MRNIKADIERLYDGVFSAYESVPITDDETGIVTGKRQEYLKDIPCRISYQLINENKQSRFISYKNQTVRLFTSPDVVVKEGSDISVTVSGRSEEYILSGSPAVYTSHQEILLKIKNVR